MPDFLSNPLRPIRYFEYFPRKPRNSTEPVEVKIWIPNID